MMEILLVFQEALHQHYLRQFCGHKFQLIIHQYPNPHLYEYKNLLHLIASKLLYDLHHIYLVALLSSLQLYQLLLLLSRWKYLLRFCCFGMQHLQFLLFQTNSNLKLHLMQYSHVLQKSFLTHLEWLFRLLQDFILYHIFVLVHLSSLQLFQIWLLLSRWMYLLHLHYF